MCLNTWPENSSKITGETALELFECPKEIDPLFFSCVELYYFSERDRKAMAPSFKEREANGKRGVGAAHVVNCQVGDESAIGPNLPQGKSGRKSKSNFPPKKKKFKNDSGDLGGFAGQVTVGDKKNPMCIPVNSSKTIIGKVPRVDRKLTYLVEKTEDSNLPIGVGVNNTLVTPSKSGLVSVILINNNNHNVWIRQPLYAADLWEVEPKEWEYEPVLAHEEGTNNVTINFVQVPPEEFREDIFSNATEAEENGPASETGNKNSQGEEKPKFGSPPDYDSPDFDFKGECEWLPFLLNVGEAPLDLDQQKRFIRLIYENQEVFSLYDGDLGYCDKLKHSIPTTTNKPVYLPHQQIPIQLQLEVRKCLDAWLKAGIIRPSKSPYASQVVIVRKKTGEIRLCVDFRKLNAISIRDSFPLPRIEEALQAVQAGYLVLFFQSGPGLSPDGHGGRRYSKNSIQGRVQWTLWVHQDALWVN